MQPPMPRVRLRSATSPFCAAARFCAGSLLAFALGCRAPKPAAPPVATPVAPLVVAPPVDPALSARVDAVLDAELAAERIVGAVVLVARDGQLVYHRAAGFADREAQIAVSEPTQFRLASMSKPIVSIAALALVEAHALDLQDPVSKYLPHFQPALADGQKPEITIRQLLTHTSGLDYPWGEPPGGPYHRLNVSSGFDQPGLSLAENLDRLNRVPLLSAPGAMWRYSLGIDVLGGVVAQAGGSTLPEVVQRLVTGPLHMTAGFRAPEPALLAVPYLDAEPRAARMTDPQRLAFAADAIVYSPSRIFNAASYPSGGMGMVGTASDYLKFLEMLRTGGGPVLQAESAAAATSNQIGELPVAFGKGWGWGYGFAVLQVADPTLPWAVGTWRWIGGYGSHFWVDPSAKLSVVVLTNTALHGALGSFADQLRNAVYGFEPPEQVQPDVDAAPSAKQ
jgi:CubicO group peptidase (beta-lactamase class C family)